MLEPAMEAMAVEEGMLLVLEPVREAIDRFVVVDSMVVEADCIRLAGNILRVAGAV